jgi:hypothetical protein
MRERQLCVMEKAGFCNVTRADLMSDAGENVKGLRPDEQRPFRSRVPAYHWARDRKGLGLTAATVWHCHPIAAFNADSDRSWKELKSDRIVEVEVQRTSTVPHLYGRNNGDGKGSKDIRNRIRVCTFERITSDRDDPRGI